MVTQIFKPTHVFLTVYDTNGNEVLSGAATEGSLDTFNHYKFTLTDIHKTQEEEIARLKERIVAHERYEAWVAEYAKKLHKEFGLDKKP